MSELAQVRAESRYFWQALPSAFLLWLLLAWLLGLALTTKLPLLPVATIDAQLVVLAPSSAASHNSPPVAPKSVALPSPQTMPDNTALKSVVKTPVLDAAKLVKPADSTPAKAAVNTVPTSAVSNSPRVSSGLGTENHGAQAQFKPEPKVPDDLTDAIAGLTVAARVYVAIDGTVRIELIQRAPDPRINKIVLDTLKQWTFLPAVQSGKAVASSVDLAFKF